jgi:hypothetical protein
LKKREGAVSGAIPLHAASGRKQRTCQEQNLLYQRYNTQCVATFICIRNQAREHRMSKQTWQSLLENPLSAQTAAQAECYLDAQLAQARTLPCELPDDPAGLTDWMMHAVESVGVQYLAYLDERKRGAGRRLFRSRAHAMHFLKGVAPTKLVDGAWLFGTVRQWHDVRLAPLIRTYLEELGNGSPDKNHVLLYRRLLESHDLEPDDSLNDDHYVQGAIQLALGCHAQDYLPEIIGFNLGYEQLPLHLLITSYELNELGLDPYYFTLHVTVDNADTGHARKAVDAVLNCLPQLGDSEAFYARVRDGFRLNDLGANTMSIISGFDLDAELMTIMRRKATVGRYVHPHTARIAGRSLNDWLSSPENTPGLLAGLEQMGWIRRNAPADESRFWQLIAGERGEMFGVFTTYEQQVLRDWIEGEDNAAVAGARSRPATRRPAQRSFRAQQRLAERQRQASAALVDEAYSPEAAPADEIETIAATNEQALTTLARINAVTDRATLAQALAELISPAVHWTPLGLLATRTYIERVL